MQATQAQRAYQHLRSKLVCGDFVPGSRIRYGPVGKELGISATPVREAIGQLANEGFVELVPQLGAVVRQISRGELIELYEMREALEPYAAARAAERIAAPQLDEIDQAYQRMRRLAEGVDPSATVAVGRPVVQQFEEADLTFHMLIIEAAGNQTMVRAVGNSHVLTRIFATQRHAYDAAVMAATCDDHQRIVVALRARDADAARHAMGTHIRNGLEITLANEPQRAERWWQDGGRPTSLETSL